MRGSPHISIIVPTLYNAVGVRRLLDSIAAQQSASFQSLEVLVVSNFDDARIKELENHNYPFPLRTFVSGVQGVNVARNVGVRFAKGRWYYFLDDDCQLIASNHLQVLNEKISKLADTVVGIGGGYQIASEASLADVAYLLTSQHWLESSRLENGHYHLVGGNACISSEVFNKGYSFNEAIRFGGAETEFNLRLCKDGYRFSYDRSLHVLHSTNLGLFQICKKALFQGMGAGIREYYGVKDLRDQVSKPVDLLRSQKYSGLARKIIAFYLSIYDFFFEVGFFYFQKERLTQVSGVRLFGLIVGQVERRVIDSVKKSFVGRFYFQGKKLQERKRIEAAK